MAKKKVVTNKTPTKGAKKKAPKKGTPVKYRKDTKEGNVPDPKAASQKVKALPESITLEGTGILTLLDVPNRKKLPEPPIELDAKIYDIVRNRQDEYKEFLGFIGDGFSISSACSGSGVGTYTEIMTYIRRGMQDITRNKKEIEDSYYSRFYIDFTRIAGVVVGEAEANLKDTDPKFWLRNSQVSRLFGDHWRDDPDKKVSHFHTGSIEHSLGLDRPEEKSNPDELYIEGELVAGAIEEMAHAGLVNLTPDFELAKRIQRGEILSDDELEALEDEESTGSDGVLQLNSEGMPLLLPNPDEDE